LKCVLVKLSYKALPYCSMLKMTLTHYVIAQEKIIQSSTALLFFLPMFAMLGLLIHIG